MGVRAGEIKTSEVIVRECLLGMSRSFVRFNGGDGDGDPDIISLSWGRPISVSFLLQKPGLLGLCGALGLLNESFDPLIAKLLRLRMLLKRFPFDSLPREARLADDCKGFGECDSMLTFPILYSSSEFFAIKPFELRREVPLDSRMDVWSGCSRPSRRPPNPLPTPGKLGFQGLGETGVDTDTPASGKLSKCSLTGEEMAERVSIREEMTSGEAGLTET